LKDGARWDWAMENSTVYVLLAKWKIETLKRTKIIPAAIGPVLP